MKFFGLEKLSLVDYDGKVSATVFTGGCNFRCGFCHNSPLVTQVESLQEMSEEYVLDYLSSRKNIIEGLCITGGEPTLQKDLPSFCEKVKALGVSIKLDTNGTCPALIIQLTQNGLIDYLAMDIKNSLNEYAKIIGFDKYDTKNVEESVDYLINGTLPFEFRTTLVKEFHTHSSIKEIGEWIKGTDKYFLQKFKDGEGCIVQGYSPIDKNTANEFIDILTPYVKTPRLRGYD